MGVIQKYRGDPANKDPFLEDFFRNMSPALIHSFTDEQLRAIKMQFAARDRGAHTVDLRFSVPWLSGYVVLLIGKERRSRRRRQKDRLHYPLATVGNVLVTLLLFGFVAAPVLIVIFGLALSSGVGPAEAVGPGMMETLRQQLVHLIKTI